MGSTSHLHIDILHMCMSEKCKEFNIQQCSQCDRFIDRFHSLMNIAILGFGFQFSMLIKLDQLYFVCYRSTMY